MKLRPAVAADCDHLLDWANDTETRAASFHPEPISAETHRRWFEASLEGARRLYVIERDGVAAGVARLDPLSANAAEVSLTIAPGLRCRGIGLAALELLADAARDLGVGELKARIRKDNAHSQRTFERAGFEHVGEEIVNGVAALVYRRAS